MQIRLEDTPSHEDGYSSDFIDENLNDFIDDYYQIGRASSGYRMPHIDIARRDRTIRQRTIRPKWYPKGQVRII